MPRILKPGKIPVPDVPWQMRTTFICRFCGCEWQADRDEWIDMVPWVAGDAGCASMHCPTCGNRCQIREPGKPITRGVTTAEAYTPRRSPDGMLVNLR